jgi:hypothetical protein
MMSLGESADIKWWFHFLTEECHLRLGTDWSWGWQHDAWAVEFRDPKHETLVRLKMNGQ